MPRIIGTALNVATGGAWGALKWLGRRFKGNGDKQTFFGRVAVFVAGHAVFSAMTGAISLWGLFKMFGRSILYLCLAILHLAGGEGKLPAEEDAKAKGFIAKTKDAMDDRMERMKAAMEDRRQKIEEELARKKREIEERDFASEISRKKREAEDEIARKRAELEGREREIADQAKAAMEAKSGELAAKAKAEIKERMPTPWGLMFGQQPKQKKYPTQEQAASAKKTHPADVNGRAKFFCEKCEHVEKMRDYGINPLCQRCGYHMGYDSARYFGETGLRP